MKRDPDATVRRLTLAAVDSTLAISRLARTLAELYERTIAPAGRLLAL